MADNTKVISMLVCFEGKNRRIEINPKKCNVNNATKAFEYKTKYKADNGKTYMVTAVSVNDSNGAKANVVITNTSGKKLIAERHNVDVRFSRYLFS